MLRGINGQEIFKDDEDYENFIYAIQEYKEESGYEVYAYCLMNNHIHLLIKEVKEDLGIVFRRIGAKFVYWYNQKYGRYGHLFQDRYRSEVVENDRYFLTAIRYIHQNPVKAGIVKEIIKYPWTSYREYIGKKGICDTEYVLNMFSHDKSVATALFKEFNIADNDDKCIDNEKQVRINDVEAARIIFKIAGVENLNQVGNLEIKKRDVIIKKLKDNGLSIRQIERLTGISFGIIRKA